MVADDVDDRTVGPTGVVQVGQAVAEAGAEMEQGGGGPAGDARVPVGGAGGHALEEGQYRPHRRDVVEGGHEVHLRGTRVHEAGVDTVVDQGVDQ